MHLVLPSHSTDGGGGGGVGLGVVEPVDVNTNTNISTNMRFVNMSGYGRKVFTGDQPVTYLILTDLGCSTLRGPRSAHRTARDLC